VRTKFRAEIVETPCATADQELARALDALAEAFAERLIARARKEAAARGVRNKDSSANARAVREALQACAADVPTPAQP